MTDLFPTGTFPAIAALFGLLVGSFLNVVVHRVPRGRSVVHPPSACPGCGHPVRWFDNVPVLSWLVLRGRCRDCGAAISVRYPAVELLTAAVFAGVTALVGVNAALPAYLYLAAIAVALTLIDLDHRRLPDAIVKPSYPVAIGLLTLASAVQHDWSALGRAAVAGLALGALYTVLWLAGGMGRGDAKLAGVLGLYLGWWGWDAVVVGAFGAFLVGGVCCMPLLLTGRAGRRSRVPFGPSMLVAALAALAVAGPLTGWYLTLLGLRAPA